VDATAQFQDRLNQVAGTPKACSINFRQRFMSDELAGPARSLDAMRHASLGAGKRFRPFLVVESASPSACRVSRR
jgi:farnesyl diphosphate synthase